MTVLAAFAAEDAMQRAAEQLRAQSYQIETYTPKPPKEVADRQTTSILPLVIFVVAMIAVAGGFGLQVYANVAGYPWDIGGRPPFSWPAFVPIAFEISILFALPAGVFGFLVACRMPRLHEPIDECFGIREATRDRWFIAVEGDPAKARQVLSAFNPETVQEVPP